jgi:uncharacterized protein YbbC (DUF1343 family)
MTEMPMAIPVIPIFTIGLEMLPLFRSGPRILPAMKLSIRNNFAMHKNNKLNLLSVLLIIAVVRYPAQNFPVIRDYSSVTSGAAQFGKYLSKIKGKRVAILTNATGIVGTTSIVDTLLKKKIHVKKIFGPEHGFRGNTDAGMTVENNKDIKTGLPVISLYGSNKKPTREQLKDIDVLIYDIQDVGVRFYTYISTMCYAMEACAENRKQMIILDRPNPNGFFIDGPVLKSEYKSFLGLHPVPIVYGMTCGEYAMMANEEGWLNNKVKCRLTVIPMVDYDRNASYRLPVKPSPNLPNEQSVLLYPGLGLFEGTIISVGRGTEFPFQVAGHPQFPDSTFCFTPRANEVTKEPKYVNQLCCGFDLRKDSFIVAHPRQVNIDWIKLMMMKMNREDFFDSNFNYHAGNKDLQEQLKNQLPSGAIRETWRDDLTEFKKIRVKYLLYPDFL